VGVNECISRLFEQREIVCAINPVSGRERQWGDGTLVPVEPAERKRVVVVGGGPAGMKTASVAAKRGHQVVLLERTDELGGHLNLLKRLPTRSEWQDAIDNLRRAMANAGVEVRLSVAATVPVLEGLGADQVIWAAGATWDPTGFSPSDPSRDALPGSDQANVLTVGEAVARALQDPGSLGRRVVISEETGTYLPLGLAELLAQHGVAVEVVSPSLYIGDEAMRQFDLQLLFPELKRMGVRLVNQQAVDRIDGSVVTVRDIWSREERTIADVDTLVLSHMRVPMEDGLDAARARFPTLITVGDVVAPRKLSEIMFEGEKVGRSI
jgi:hypothetical protein